MVFRDAEDPGPESGVEPQLAEMLPGGEKRILRDILGREGISDDLLRLLQHCVLIPRHQFVERAVLADQRKIDQRLVVQIPVFSHIRLLLFSIRSLRGAFCIYRRFSS